MPGTYKATVAKRVDGVVTPLGQPQQFQIVVEGQESMSTTDRTALVEFQQKAVRLQRAVSGAIRCERIASENHGDQACDLRDTVVAAQPLRHRNGLEKRNNEIIRALSGDAEADAAT